MIVEIIPEKRTGPDKDTFSYLVPEKLQADVKAGSICSISFGRKTIRGVVSQLSVISNQLSVDFKLKEIKSVDAAFTIPEKYIDIAKWISEYYLCSLGEAIALFLPPKISRPRNQISNIKSQISNKTAQLTTEQETVFQKLKAKLIYYSKNEAMRTQKNSSRSPKTPSNNKPATFTFWEKQKN